MNAINLEAYFATIKKKTGKTQDDFRNLAAAKGILTDGKMKPSVKATEVFKWLKDDFALGRGHAMAIFHTLKGEAEYG